MIFNIENEEELISLLKEKQTVVVYVETPLCGTCMTAKKMLMVINEIIPEIPFTFCNINMLPAYTERWKIKSVPYLAIIQNGQVKEEVYAFKSVDFIYRLVKQYM